MLYSIRPYFRVRASTVGAKFVCLCMQFYYPTLLWALWALVLPLLIHLFHLRRAKRVYFSHLPILQQSVHTSHTRSKLRHRVVLFCRLLALAALVVAFSQPYLLGPKVGGRSAQVLLYVDNSYSMQNLTASEEAALEEALYLAQQVVKSYGQKTKFFLLTDEPSSLRSYHQQEMLDRLSTVSYSIYRRSAAALQQRLQSLLEQATESMDVYWISDFQKNLFSGASVEKDSLHNWYAISVRGANSYNLFIDTAYSETPVWVSREPNRLCVRVQNMRDVPCDPCAVKFLVEGVQQALQTLRVDAQQTTEVCFAYTPSAFRSQRVELRVNDSGVQFDNTFYVSLTEAPAVEVMEIAAAEAPSYVEQVYAENTRFNYSRYSPEALPYEQLYTQDLLILNELPRLSSVLVQSLEDVLAAGGTLLCISPEVAVEESYTLLFPGFSAVKEGPRLELLASPDYQGAFYSQVFSRSEPQAAMPSASLLYQWHAVDLQSILQFADGRLFLSRAQREGHRYLLASSLSQKHTNFTQHSLFVPTMYKIATTSQPHNERLFYRTETKELRLPLRLTSVEAPIFQLRTEGEALQSLRVEHRGQKYALYLEEAVQRPGFYMLQQDTLRLMWLAFNLPAAESDLRTLGTEAIAKKLSPLRQLSVMAVDASEELYASFSEDYSPRQLWRYFLCAALLFLLVEVACLRYFWKSGFTY